MNDAVATFWGAQAKELETTKARIWLSHPLIQQRMRVLITGADIDIWSWFFDRLAQDGVQLPVEKIVSIGCGAGELERGLSYAAHEIVGTDLSDEALAIARQAAKDAGAGHISYRQADLNKIDFSQWPCSILIANMAVHHIENLEGFFSGARSALSNGGYLLMNEFIGPARFQWTESQVAIINRLLDAIPEPLRRTRDDAVRAGFVRPSIEEMLAADPSESVRSNEIMSVLRQHFDIVEYRPWRGALLHMLFSDIIANFMSHAVVEGYVTLIAAFEDILTESGILSDDFAAVIARPKPR